MYLMAYHRGISLFAVIASHYQMMHAKSQDKGNSTSDGGIETI